MEERRIKARLKLLDNTELPVNQLLIEFWDFRIDLQTGDKWNLSDKDVLILFKKHYLKMLPEDLKQKKLFE